MDETTENKIATQLMENLTKKDIELEVGRFISQQELFQDPNSIQIWIIKQNTRQITEKTVELDHFSEFQINLTFVSPNFFTDIYDGLDVPYWQIATVKRALKNCRIVYDPQEFIKFCIEKNKNLTWNQQSIDLKLNVSYELIRKAEHFLKEEMLADAYMWAIKAVEEAICVQIMKNGLF